MKFKSVLQHKQSVGREWVERVLKFVVFNDILNDDEWFKITFANAGKFDVNIGNNEWTNGILEKAGFPILRFPYYKRYLYEGKKIRELMRQDKKWQHLVPDCIATYLGKTLQKVE